MYGPSSKVRAAVLGTVQLVMICARGARPSRVTLKMGTARTRLDAARRARAGRAKTIMFEENLRIHTLPSKGGGYEGVTDFENVGLRITVWYTNVDQLHMLF
jgi:hypothetical protein